MSSATTARFNPSRGIAIIQTQRNRRSVIAKPSFNPSRGIAIIQTWTLRYEANAGVFQSLTRDSNHSNYVLTELEQFSQRFNPSRGIAIIQTQALLIKQAGIIVSIPHAG